MKTVKKIAWLLSFVLIVSAVFGNVNLRATAQGEGTTFTITVDDQSGVAGNAVTYSFDNNSWNPVSSGTPIDISGNDVIHVQVTKADNVNVDCSESTGFAQNTDFGGITGGGIGNFNLESDTSYGLKVKFTRNNVSSNNLTFSYDNTDTNYGQVEWKDSAGQWHTQTAAGSVSATAVRIIYSNNGTLASHTELCVDGIGILASNKTALESSVGLSLEAGENYSFEHIEFVSNGNTPPPGPQPPTFDGIVYFVWQGANDAFCIHKITGLTGQASNGTFPINYIRLSDVKDDVSNEPFAISNKNYYWVWGSKGSELFVVGNDSQLTDTRRYNKYSDFNNYLTSNEEILRGIAIDPCGAENGESTVCTNGDRTFRATIYADSTFEGVAFNQNKNDYTYFPNFWDNAVFTNTVDISGTTEANPAIYEAFILEPTIHFGKADNSANAFTGIRALNVPDGAVTINGDAASGYDIRFGSNFFDNVVFEITTAAGNYYLEIVRTAIQAFDTAGPGEDNPTIVAEVYYDSAKSYSNYEVYATVHYADGRVSMQKMNASEITYDGLGNPMAPGTYEMEAGTGLKCAHYNIPLSENIVGVDFNAIESGALSGTTYGGSYFGSGKGVYYDIATRRVIY